MNTTVNTTPYTRHSPNAASLNEAGLIAIRQTERDQLYPERTVYELTEQGRREAVAWLDDMLSTPRNEFPEFPAALSFAMMLGPEGVLSALERRAAQLTDRVAELDASLESNSGTVPRVALIEDEYLRAVSAAELAWLHGLAGELRSGTLTWSRESLAAALTMPDSAIPGPAD
jgi:DNA-binding PadR family transcriptional regulator